MPGVDLRLARRDLADAGLQHLAHHDVLHLLGRDVGALERGLDGDAAELGGLEGGESAAELADGRAGGAEDHGLGHGADDSLRRCEIRATTDDPPDTGADTIVVGVFDGKGDPARRRRTARCGALVDVRRGALGVPQAHPRARRGPALDPDRARRARRLRRRARADRGGRPRSAARASSARATLCWELPHKVGDAVAGRARRGHAAGRLPLHGVQDRSRARTARPTELVVSAHHDVSAAVEAGRAGAEAANRARDLGNAPANVLTPAALAAARARAAGRAGRGDGPRRDRGGRDGRVRRGRAGRRRRAAADHDPPRARRRGRAAARPRRQGGDVRHRRLLDQAGRADARDEVRHVRRRGRARGDRRDRASSACRCGSSA